MQMKFGMQAYSIVLHSTKNGLIGQGWDGDGHKKPQNFKFVENCDFYSAKACSNPDKVRNVAMLFYTSNSASPISAMIGDTKGHCMGRALKFSKYQDIIILAAFFSCIS